MLTCTVCKHEAFSPRPIYNVLSTNVPSFNISQLKENETSTAKNMNHNINRNELSINDNETYNDENEDGDEKKMKTYCRNLVLRSSS